MSSPSVSTAVWGTDNLYSSIRLAHNCCSARTQHRYHAKAYEDTATTRLTTSVLAVHQDAVTTPLPLLVLFQCCVSASDSAVKAPQAGHALHGGGQ